MGTLHATARRRFIRALGTFEQRAEWEKPTSGTQERAFACCIAEWLTRNPVTSMPGLCLGCGH